MRIAVTSGEPAGIGPDLCLTLLAQGKFNTANTEYVLLGNRTLFQQRAEQLGLNCIIPEYTPQLSAPVSLLDTALGSQVIPGELDSRNANYVCALLQRAVDGCLNHEFAAIVTAPVQKSVINDAGIAFSGHTEFFAERCHAHPIMMLAASNPQHSQLQQLRVALTTTHLSLAQVPAAITQDSVTKVIDITYSALIKQFGITNPHLGICGLNPHAGESGHLGAEEINIIQPCIEAFRQQGLRLSDALPADTIFAPKIAQQYDAIIAMYHDQGLPVLKHYGFGNAVNITLGLPIIRTSVDHGTALERTATGNIDSGSMAAALDSAIAMAKQQLN